MNFLAKSFFEKDNILAFDEGSQPSKNRTKLLRINRSKPHSKFIQKFLLTGRFGALHYIMIDCDENRKKFLQYSKDNKINYQSSILAVMLQESNVLQDVTSDVKACTFCDRAFTSVGLVLHLLKFGIGYCGTIKSNARNLPPMCKIKKINENLFHVAKPKPQECQIWETNNSKVAAVDYSDTASVRLISSLPVNHSIIVTQKKQRKVKNVNKSQSQIQSNENTQNTEVTQTRKEVMLQTPNVSLNFL